MDLSGLMSLAESATAILSELHPDFKDIGHLRSIVEMTEKEEDGRNPQWRINEMREADSQTDDALIQAEFDKLTAYFEGPFVPEGIDLAVTYDQEISPSERESPQRLSAETHQDTSFGRVRSFRPKLEFT